MKLGLALAGGGMRGIAHVGVLKALEENKIKIDAIGGTSAGGLVASLYAMGYSPYYIYILFKQYAKEVVNINTTPIINGVGSFMTSRKLKMVGFQTGEIIEKMYDDLAYHKGIKTIKDIKMPIAIPALEICDSKEYVFTNYIPYECENKNYITNISVGKALRASSSFPVMFCPCEFENHKFLDGGALENVPVASVKKMGVDKVIAVNFATDDINQDSNVIDIVMKTIDIMGNKIVENDLNKSDLLLNIKTSKLDIFDTKNLDESYYEGYNLTKTNINKIRNLIRCTNR